MFCHTDDGEGDSVGEGNGDGSNFGVAAMAVKRDSGESGTHFEAGEALCEGGLFAVVKEEGSDAAAGPVWVDEEGSDFGGVDGGVEEFGFADGGLVASEEGFAFAPAATSDEFVGGCFYFEIGLVGDELGVDAEDSNESGFDLFGCVFVGLQGAHG